jgi:anti-sigma regulatory factor (Ser/Thr protein kinase)
VNTSPSSAAIADEAHDASGIRHEAWLYSGTEAFVAGSSSFVRDALDAEEAVMVATTPTNLQALEDELGADASEVALVDMSEAGRNPGRILSMWREFVAAEVAHGRPARGIGEPVWQGRTPAELDECCRHEALINRAFDQHSDFWLLCPYDKATLDDATLASAGRTHPYLHDDGAVRPSRGFDPGLADHALEGDLPQPPTSAERFVFEHGRLAEMRALLRVTAARAGLDARRTSDLALAITELAANSIRHDRGTGTVAVWGDPDALVCEVTASGGIDDPLAGRAKAPPEQLQGRGLWIVHQVCDLVQIRSSDHRSTIRVTLRTA